MVAVTAQALRRVLEAENASGEIRKLSELVEEAETEYRFAITKMRAVRKIGASTRS